MSIIKTISSIAAKNISHSISPLFILSLFCAAALAQNYSSSENCGYCHTDKYNIWIDTGHHYALVSDSAAPPEYPFQYHPGSNNVPNPPFLSGAPMSWSDISYVVGGYYWKANFLDRDGYIVTGNQNDSTLWNVRENRWLPYNPGQQAPFDCGKCHTTGYSPEGHQGGLSGVTGTWTEDGVGCEACHGPGA